MPEIIMKSGPTANNIAPQMPSEPTKEALETKFEFDPSLFSGEGDNTTVKIDGKELPKTEEVVASSEGAAKGESSSAVEADNKKVEEVKKVEETKKEEVTKPKSGLKPPASTEVKDKAAPLGDKAVSKAITPVKKDAPKEGEADTFDYTPFSPAEVTNLKNMSRQSREFTANLMKENKSLSGLKEANYLQHEQAYTLSPEYQEAQVKDYKARTEGKVWYDALLNIRAGKPFRPITGFDKQGKAILGAEIPASDAADIDVQNNLNLCNQAVQGAQQELQTIPNQYKQRIDTDLTAINNAQKEKFAWVNDPKLLDYTVEIDGLGEFPLKQVIEDFRQIWPTYMRNTPAVNVACNLYAAMTIQSAELREAQKGQSVAQIKQAEAARGETSSDSRQVEEVKTINGKAIPKAFDLSGMPSR